MHRTSKAESEENIRKQEKRSNYAYTSHKIENTCQKQNRRHDKKERATPENRFAEAACEIRRKAG